METLENSYAISLLPLASLAIDVYGEDPCQRFVPQGEAAFLAPSAEQMLMARMHKAITLMQFKLEAQVIGRHSEYGMQDRRLLEKIDLRRGTIATPGGERALLETRFPTVAADHPYDLSSAEQQVMERLRQAFLSSARLQEHVRFLFSKGSIYKISNGNLLFHGCIPMNGDGSFKAMVLNGERFAGRQLMERLEQLARQGYFARDDGKARQEGLDAMWYLWCGPSSPLFGKEKMATFERYLVEDGEMRREARNVYYRLRDSEAVACRILQAFGLDPDQGHIVNGHVPVIVKQHENPVKAGGKLIVIDGGFSPTYQQKTGIAGYTLVYNSWGLLLSTHQRPEGNAASLAGPGDIACTTDCQAGPGFGETVRQPFIFMHCRFGLSPYHSDERNRMPILHF